MKEENNNTDVVIPKRKKFDEPEICPICKGACVVPGELTDEICEQCEGEGVIWKY